MADDARRALASVGFLTTVCDHPDQLRDAAAEALAEGSLRCVLAAGGDGTFGAALNTTPSGTPLVMLPLGTENLLARYLRHSRRPAEIVRLVTGGVAVEFDAGVANGRLFTLMASVGFDAEVVRRVHERRTASGVATNITHLAYAQPILGAMSGYAHPRLRVTVEDAEGASSCSIEGSWLFASNLPCYASGLRIAPQADGLDGQLDLCLFRRGQLAAGLWYFWHVLRRRHHRLRSVDLLRAARCRVESVTGAEVPYQIDGDAGGVLPLELSVVPRRVTVLVSRSTARRVFNATVSTEGQRTCPTTPLTTETTEIARPG